MMAQEVLPGLTREFATPYLDDVIVFSENQTEHLKHLRLVLERLAIHGLRCAPQKCELGKTEVKYLGHIVDGEGQRPQEQHLHQIATAKPPKTKKELRSFLGTCNWLREYVPRFAEITSPLTDLLATQQKWRWGPTEHTAFEGLKKIMAKPMRLHRPDPRYRLILQTDASGVGMAAVLYQEVEGTRKIVAYASAKFNEREKRYHANEQECLALMFGIKKYRAYLEDKPFLVRTDSRAVTWLQKMKDSKAKLTRWSLELQEYSFELEHCPGRFNELPDFLSRHPEKDAAPENTEEDVERMLPPEAVACPADVITLAEEVREAQRTNDETQRVIQIRNEFENNPPDARRQRELYRPYQVEDGILLFGPDRKLYVPPQARARVMFEHHDTALAGHPGAEETARAIMEAYHWPNLLKTVKKYVAECILCAQFKKRNGQQAAPLRPRQPQRAFETLAVDIMGPYPATPTRNRFILVVTDLFSRWVEAFPMRNAAASTIIRLMEDQIFPRFGYPTAIITDNGPQFIGNQWTRACDRWRATAWYTATYQPRQNPAERRNQEVKNVLKMNLKPHEGNRWDEKIPSVLFSLRRRRNAATGASPSKLLYGTDLRYPGAWDAPSARTPPEPQEVLHQRARENQARYIQTRQRDPPERPPPAYAANDRVLVRAVPAARQPFQPRWKGPHRIVRRIRDTDMYLVDTGNRVVKIHIDRIKPAPRQRDPELQ